jgi:hypothetical protein
MGEPAEEGHQPCHLLEDLRRAAIAEGPTEFASEALRNAPGQLRGDPPIGLGETRRIDGLPHALDPALGVREGPFLLGKGGRRQEHVRKLRRLVQEQVLDDQALELGNRLLGVMQVRLGQQRVLADHVQGADTAAEAGLDHVGDDQPWLGGGTHAPGLLELAQTIRPVVLVARQVGRNAARIATSLDVVLPAQRRDAGPGKPELSGHEREVQQGVRVVDAVDVLGDAHAPDETGAAPRRARVPARGARDVVRRHAGHRRRAVERELRQGRAPQVEAVRARSHEIEIR